MGLRSYLSAPTKWTTACVALHHLLSHFRPPQLSCPLPAPIGSQASGAENWPRSSPWRKTMGWFWPETETRERVSVGFSVAAAAGTATPFRSRSRRADRADKGVFNGLN
uniref:Uncharacterized protein n=1 Tax=Rhizophora mucronata TaxID=61149 RepID=A0A2P2PDY1_RHIMU